MKNTLKGIVLFGKIQFLDAKTLCFLKFFWFIIAIDKRTLLVHLAGVDSVNLPFLGANGFKLYQIAG